MVVDEPKQFADLDARSDLLRVELSRKSSLFDVLTPPPDRPSDPVKVQDAKLRRAINGFVSCTFSFGMLLVLHAISPSPNFKDGSVQFLLLLLVLVGFVAQTHSLLSVVRDRITTLEKELREMRQNLLPAAPDSSSTTLKS